MASEDWGLRALVLGAAAGGGFPQWNCACRLCCLARDGDPRAKPGSQASIAVSTQTGCWFVVGASPDLRQQILATPLLHPDRTQPRGSPIRAVVLLSADIDGIAGLTVLRERQALRLFAPRAILDVLDANAVFRVLDPALVERVELQPDGPVTADGLTLTLLAMPGKIPLYLENRESAVAEPGPAFAVRVQAAGRSLVIAPTCAVIDDAVRKRLRGHDAIFFDGTLFEDDEIIRAGAGHKTGRRMGHAPIAGPGGSLAGLAGVAGRRIFFHINNTNPILLMGSPERLAVEAAGFEVGFDGMDVRL